MSLNINKTTQKIKFETFEWKEVFVLVEKFKEKVEAMLIWWAIWDAMWVPVEMRTKEQISNRYWRLDKYLPAIENLFFKKWWLESNDSWLISDDTILTFSWVKSLLNSKWIDFDNIVLTSIEDYKNFPYWFWRGTREAFEKYENWVPYTETWNVNSAWNWVVMKQSPYAAYSLKEDLSQKSIDDNLEILTKITHPHPVAIVASLVHNKFLMELLKSNKDIDFYDILNDLYHYSSNLENKFYSEEELKELDKISNLILDLMDDYLDWWLSDEEILEKYGWGDKQIYASGYVLTTLWICYSIFIRNKQDFDTLLDSINIWWDVDTFWSIVWNMIWAYKWKFYEKKYEEWLKSFEWLKENVDKFNDFLLS